MKNKKSWRIIGLVGVCLFTAGISLEIIEINNLLLREWLGLGKIISFSLAISGFAVMFVSVIYYSLGTVKNKQQ